MIDTHVERRSISGEDDSFAHSFLTRLDSQSEVAKPSEIANNLGESIGFGEQETRRNLSFASDVVS